MPPTIHHLRVGAFCFPVLQQAAGGAGAAGVDGRLADLDVLNHAILVDDKSGAVREALLFVQNAVVFGYRPLEVAKEWEAKILLLRERGVGSRAVHADAENLSVVLLELGDISLIRLQLLRSTTGEGQDVKGQHHVFLPQIIAELYILPIGVLERELRRLVTDLEFGGLRHPGHGQGKQESPRYDAQSG